MFGPIQTINRPTPGVEPNRNGIMKSLTRIALAAWAAAILISGPASRSASADPGVYHISDGLGEPRYLPGTNQVRYSGGAYGVGGCGAYGYLGSAINGFPMHPYVKGAVWLPSIHPVQRDPVLYQRWWPHRWYGMPGGGIARDAMRAPVVYVPTDTTQLGYYNQRVPFWTPRPGMYPTAAPDPTMLHNYTRPALGHRWYYGSHYYGVPQHVPGTSVGNAKDSKSSNGDAKPAPKNDDRPPIPGKLDKAAAAPPAYPGN